MLRARQTVMSGEVKGAPNGGGSPSASSGTAFFADVEGGSSTGAGATLPVAWGGVGSAAAAPSRSLYTNAAIINSVCGLLLASFLGEAKFPVIVFTLCVNGLVFAKYLSDWLLSKDDGTMEMRAVSEPIREGSQAFLRVQYSAIGRLSVVVAGVIFLSYQMRSADANGGVSNLSSTTLGVISALSFVMGALCSAAAGYVSMHIAAQTNIRVTSAARRGYMEALAICFRGGAFSAVLVLAMCVMGVTLLHSFLTLVFVSTTGAAGSISPADVPLLCVGYGFGASFVALFMQLGGGIYTKAADVGADMVGKIEAGIPEDDPRNPAVVSTVPQT